LVSAVQQFAHGVLEIRPIPGPHKQAAHQLDARQDGELSIDGIREKLRLLALKKAAVQEKIYATRNALTALISLFGPGILTEERKTVVAHGITDLSRSKPKDLFTNALIQSDQWTTVPELLQQIQHNCPSALARFKNPGASLSNFLRTLLRKGQVELRVQDGQRMWKWLDNTGPSRHSLHGEVI
jgi:hypothetical protein